MRLNKINEAKQMAEIEARRIHELAIKKAKDEAKQQYKEILEKIKIENEKRIA